MATSSPLKRSITYEDNEEEMEIARKKLRESGTAQALFNTEQGNSTMAVRVSGQNDIGLIKTRGSEHMGEEVERANDGIEGENDGMPVD
jgi:hypothetical protein